MSRAPGADLTAAPLRAILEAELASGKTVLAVTPWPPHCDVLMLLARPFHRRYPLTTAGLTYNVLGDPHDWMAEYRHGCECLACAL